MNLFSPLLPSVDADKNQPGVHLTRLKRPHFVLNGT